MFALIPGRFDDTVAVTDALNERFGLLIIIVLGEVMTGIVSGLSNDATDPHKVAVAVLCVLVGFGSWWTYFDFIGHRPPRSTRSGTTAWLLGHLPLSAAITTMGATMPALVADASHRVDRSTAWTLCGSAAAALTFAAMLMTSLQDWQAAASLSRPLAIANLTAAVAAGCIGIARPTSVLMCGLLVLTFACPWIFAVLRRATLDAHAGD